MSHTPRHLAERALALRLELVLAGRFDRCHQLAQRLAQRLELGSAPRRGTGREGQAPADQPRPPHQLIDGT